MTVNTLDSPAAMSSCKATQKPNLLQTSAGQRLKAFGWSAVRVKAEHCAAQILLRHLPLGLSIAYLPKDSLGTQWQELWLQVDTLCRDHHAIFLQVEPDLFRPLPKEVRTQWLAGFSLEEHTFQPRRTIVIDLARSKSSLP